MVLSQLKETTSSAGNGNAPHYLSASLQVALNCHNNTALILSYFFGFYGKDHTSGMQTIGSRLVICKSNNLDSTRFSCSLSHAPPLTLQNIHMFTQSYTRIHCYHIMTYGKRLGHLTLPMLHNLSDFVRKKLH